MVCARRRSRVQTPAARPKRVPLASATTSSSSRKGVDGEHRAEDFLVHQAGCRGRARARWWARRRSRPRGPATLARRPPLRIARAFAHGALDHRDVLLQLRGRRRRAHLRVGEQRVAQADLARATCTSARRNCVVEARVHEGARSGHAGLPRRGEDARQQARDGVVDRSRRRRRCWGSCRRAPACTLASRGPARAAMARPPASLPVKEILATPSWSTSASPASRWPRHDVDARPAGCRSPRPAAPARTPTPRSLPRA